MLSFGVAAQHPVVRRRALAERRAAPLRGARTADRARGPDAARLHRLVVFVQPGVAVDARRPALHRSRSARTRRFRSTADRVTAWTNSRRMRSSCWMCCGVKEATVVGHSFGSFVARRMATFVPTRVHRLVLVGAGPSADNAAITALRSEIDRLTDPVDPAFVREFQMSTIHRPVSPAFMEAVIANSRRMPADLWKTILGRLIDDPPAEVRAAMPHARAGRPQGPGVSGDRADHPRPQDTGCGARARRRGRPYAALGGSETVRGGPRAFRNLRHEFTKPRRARRINVWLRVLRDLRGLHFGSRHTIRWMTTAQAVAKALANAGIDRVFGLPGGEVLVLIDELRRAGVDFVLMRHEANAGIAAAVYGKLRGQPGVVLATLGPGAANLMLPLASAYLDQEPLLAISAQLPDEFPPSHTHQLLPLHEFYLPICRLVGKILNDNVDELVPRALAACMERPLGAAYLTLSAREATKAAVGSGPPFTGGLSGSSPLGQCARARGRPAPPARRRRASPGPDRTWHRHRQRPAHPAVAERLAAPRGRDAKGQGHRRRNRRELRRRDQRDGR